MTATQPKELQHLVSMHLFVAFGAQGDQVLFLVATRSTSEFEMVYLEVLHATANLASPVVAMQHLLVQVTVAGCIQSESRAFAPNLLQEAFLLWAGQKLVVASDGSQENLWMVAVQTGP